MSIVTLHVGVTRRGYSFYNAYTLWNTPPPLKLAYNKLELDQKYTDLPRTWFMRKYAICDVVSPSEDLGARVQCAHKISTDSIHYSASSAVAL